MNSFDTPNPGQPRSVVLFDLDGTLTDPVVGIRQAISAGLAEAGSGSRGNLDGDLVRRFIGPPLRDSFRLFCGLEGSRLDLAMAAYRAYYGTRGCFENAVYEGVPTMLAGLSGRGLRLGIATSKPTVFARRIVDHFDLVPWFDVVVGSELDGERSDKRQVIEYAICRLECRPDDTVMVGDREHDMVGAAAAGVPAIGATWGYGTITELRSAGASALCNQPGDLLDCRLLGGPEAS